MYPTTHYIKHILGSILPVFGDTSHSNNELIVLNYHGTPKSFIPTFEKQLEYFERHFDIIGPKELESYYNERKIPSKRPLLLLTFDDGIKNNLHVAEILQKRNYKAYYFVIPGFIETSKQEQRAFYLSNIRPFTDKTTHTQEDDFTAMSWEDLSLLISLGNSIGSHTYSHTLVASQSDSANSIQEIVNSKKVIEEKLKFSVNSFCSPNNTLLSIEKKEIEIIKDNYRFHFATIPGSNLHERNRFFIRRSNIETHWLSGAVKYAIGKSDRIRWKNKEKLFRSLSEF